ncbi:MAG: F0F1 ATP synthase subunit A [Leucobacter sp.]
MASLIITAASGDGEFHGPEIEEFFPEALLFAGTPFEINRIILIRLIAIAVMVAILWIGSSRLKVIPTRAQSAWEFLMDFPRKSVVIETLGEKEGNRFMPILLTIFFSTLAMNLTGIIPGLQIASTGLIGYALIMAVIAYVTFIYAGIKAHGGGFFRNALWLPGVPIAIKPVIAVLEFLSTFIIRPITLTLRLTMNMVAGHMLLVLAFLATDFFFKEMLVNQGNMLGLLGAGTFVFGIIFTVLELFVGALQAYIFTILSAIYIQMALADEH